MEGGIYTDRKCAVCGATLNDDGRKRLCRPDYPGRISTALRVHCGNGNQRIKCSPEAQRFPPGLRSETDEHPFDERDNSGEKPLGVQNPAGKWLKAKKETVQPRPGRNFHNSIIIRACDALENLKEKNSSVPFSAQ